MSCIIEVTVVPNSPAFKIVHKDGKIKVHLTSAPEKNKANMELIKELGRLLSADVRIVSGLTSKRKKIELSISREQADIKFGFSSQTTLS